MQPPAAGSLEATGSRLAGLEDDLGEGARWGMTVGISQAGVRTQIALQHLACSPDAREVAPSVWDAMCRLERMMQKRRGAGASGSPRTHVELLGAE